MSQYLEFLRYGARIIRVLVIEVFLCVVFILFSIIFVFRMSHVSQLINLYDSLHQITHRKEEDYLNPLAVVKVCMVYELLCLSGYKVGFSPF